MSEIIRKKRNDQWVWVFLGVLVIVASFSLWWAEPILFRAAGVRVELMKKAKVLRGLPPQEIAAGVGRMVKSYLDAAQHVSQARTKVIEAAGRKLTLSISLPWSESSKKKWRQRAQSAARLAAGLFLEARRKEVDVRIEIRRRDKSGVRDELVGWYTYEAVSQEYRWVLKQ